MVDGVEVNNLRFSPAGPKEQETGLLGGLSCDICGALRIDGMTLRQTVGGSITHSYPFRRDAAGRIHPYLGPLDDKARRHTECRVFALLSKEPLG